jgi:hypothetical protein
MSGLTALTLGLKNSVNHNPHDITNHCHCNYGDQAMNEGTPLNFPKIILEIEKHLFVKNYFIPKATGRRLDFLIDAVAKRFNVSSYVVRVIAGDKLRHSGPGPKDRGARRGSRIKFRKPVISPGEIIIPQSPQTTRAYRCSVCGVALAVIPCRKCKADRAAEARQQAQKVG